MRHSKKITVAVLATLSLGWAMHDETSRQRTKDFVASAWNYVFPSYPIFDSKKEGFANRTSPHKAGGTSGTEESGVSAEDSSDSDSLSSESSTGLNEDQVLIGFRGLASEAKASKENLKIESKKTAANSTAIPSANLLDAAKATATKGVLMTPKSAGALEVASVEEPSSKEASRGLASSVSSNKVKSDSVRSESGIGAPTTGLGVSAINTESSNTKPSTPTSLKQDSKTMEARAAGPSVSGNGTGLNAADSKELEKGKAKAAEETKVGEGNAAGKSGSAENMAAKEVRGGVFGPLGNEGNFKEVKVPGFTRLWEPQPHTVTPGRGKQEQIYQTMAAGKTWDTTTRAMEVEPGANISYVNWVQNQVHRFGQMPSDDKGNPTGPRQDLGVVAAYTDGQYASNTPPDALAFAASDKQGFYLVQCAIHPEIAFKYLVPDQMSLNPTPKNDEQGGGAHEKDGLIGTNVLKKLSPYWAASGMFNNLPKWLSVKR